MHHAAQSDRTTILALAVLSNLVGSFAMKLVHLHPLLFDVQVGQTKKIKTMYMRV